MVEKPKRYSSKINCSTMTIELVPSWSAIVPIIARALKHGDENGQRVAMEELTRMAAVADAHVEAEKAKKPTDEPLDG